MDTKGKIPKARVQTLAPWGEGVFRHEERVSEKLGEGAKRLQNTNLGKIASVLKLFSH